jgi:uncharacterized protein (TIGR03437 family)
MSFTSSTSVAGRNPSNTRGHVRPRLLSQTIVLAALALATTLAQAQTWITINNPPPQGLFFCMLLTDGCVMCQADGYQNLSTWYKLTPDSFGSYLNGVWSSVASLPSGYVPESFASAVLADGRVVIVGGEAYNRYFALTNLGAVYDPEADIWTMLAPPPSTGTPNLFQCLGNSPATVLADGRLIIGSKLNRDIAVLDPATLSWSPVFAPGKTDGFNSEEGWTLLPDGSIFTLDVKNAPASERLLLTGPTTGFWTSSGDTPQDLQTPYSLPSPLTVAGCPAYYPPGYIGPTPLLPDGAVFAIGSDGLTAIYTPPVAGSSSTGTWSEGPEFPGLTVTGGPAAVLPGGHVLFGASPANYGNGLQYFEFDGTNLISVPAPANAALDATVSTSLLVLPTGQVLFADASATVQLYTPAASPSYSPAWAPTIGSVPPVINAATTYKISGTQFNGLDQGSVFGDDANQNSTNYPLVRITNNATGHVFYARTHDHSTMAVATGTATVSTNFDVPADIEAGPSTIQVVANGIPSESAAVTVMVSSSGEPPTVSTGSAFGVTGYSATLNGSVNPDGADTHIWFEYSTNSSLSGSISTPPQDIGPGTNTLPFSANIDGLAGPTTYYFQAWASNGAGTAHGSIASFTQTIGPNGYSDFGPDNSFTGWLCIGHFVGDICEPTTPPSSITAPFTPGSTLKLWSIGVALAGGGTSGAQISLLQDAAGVPGKSLESWQVSNLPQESGPITTVEDQLGLTLQAGQQYWVEVQPAAGSKSSLGWGLSVGGSGPAFYVSGTPGAPVTPVVFPGGVVTASAYGEFKSIAPGSWVEIYGSNLAPGTTGWLNFNTNLNEIYAPVELEGTSVTIGGQSAFVSYVSPGLVDVQVPSNVSTGTQPVIVTTEAGGASNPTLVTVNAEEPGLLAPPSFSVGGNQYVVALFPDYSTYVFPTGAIAGLASHPAQPGDTIILYGTGFGTVTPGFPAGQIVTQNNTLTAPFHIFFGNTEATVQYDGLEPYYVGLYQFNVVVPQITGETWCR